MKIYNSSSAKKVEIDTDNITMYNCGPTVYDYVHIGNIRPLLTFDVLYRYLKYLKKNITYVHNITDVDDKIINAAKAGNVSESEISTKYANAYYDIIKQLNALSPHQMPLVTKNIPGIIGYIQKLVDKGYAYATPKGDVYFSIDNVKDSYGVVSKQKIKDLLNGVRKANKDDKKNKLDFCLWKTTTEGINWKSPWSDNGRPGWHTECAYFISNYFGDQVYIHGGGIDLKFPHHENENAQHQAMYGKQMAKIWLHVGHINVDGQKMSKSLGNFIYAKDIIDKYGSDAVRWFFFQSNYKHPINYSTKLMDQHAEEYVKYLKLLNNAIYQLYLNNIKYSFKPCKVSNEFTTYIENDLDFSNIISLLWNQTKNITQLIRNRNFNDISNYLDVIISQLQILGFSFDGSINSEIKGILKAWQNALKTKDYSVADAQRQILINKNLI